MDLIDESKSLGKLIEKQKADITTKEATKREFDLLDIDEKIIPELTRCSRKSFDLDQSLSVSSELRYIQAIKSILFEESASPSLELTRFFANQVYSGKKTEQVLDQFAPIVNEAFTQFINDRPQSVMSTRAEELVVDKDAANFASQKMSGNDRVVTDEEFEGFFVVNIT
jgi:hypothetical protein